jgi:endoglucanase
MLDMFKELCSLSGVSGDEGEVRDYILNKLEKIETVETKVDSLGNILVKKSGEKRAAKKVLISAHMDEVGFIIKTVTDEGFFKFDAVGGIDPRVVLGRRVKIGKNRVLGIIGTKALHLQNEDERKTAPGFEKLLIDIGAKSKEDALKFVKPGDTAIFDSDYIEFGEGFVKARAIDDRIGCAVLLELLSRPLAFDIEASFVVQEEVGTRGAKAAAFTVNPDCSIVIEATTAADVAFVQKEKRVCFLGKGPVISFMDKGTVYCRDLYELALKTAEEKNIPCQPKLAVAGGNDARSIHVSRGGVKTIAVSLPARYIHSPSCVIKKDDAVNTLALVEELSSHMAAL